MIDTIMLTTGTVLAVSVFAFATWAVRRYHHPPTDRNSDQS
jgi:hypothetical protein